MYQELHGFEARMPGLQEERERGTNPTDSGVGGSRRIVEGCEVSYPVGDRSQPHD